MTASSEAPPSDARPTRPPALAHTAGALVLVTLVVALVLPAVWRGGGDYGLWRDERGITIVDFPALVVFVRAVWSGAADAGSSAYSVASQLATTSAWAGAPLEVALPFVYSPTMVWLLAPFAALPNHLAFTLWCLLSLAAAWWTTRPPATPRGVGLALFLSPVAFTCYALGQTACLAAAAMLVVARWSLATERSGGTAPRVLGLDRSAWPAALALCALGAKPPLAVAAACALLALGHVRVVAWAVGLTAACALVLTPWLGAGWPGDYLALASGFDRGSAGSAFAWALVPDRMSTLRALLSVDFGVADTTASGMSLAAWLVSLVVMVVGGRRAGASAGPETWACAVLTYLAFHPHVTATEVLLLVVPLALGAGTGLRRVGALAPVALLVVPFLSPAVGPLAGARAPQLALLLALAVLLRPRVSRKA